MGRLFHAFLGTNLSKTSSCDVVLDPFCGCGTTIDTAEKLGRKPPSAF